MIIKVFANISVSVKILIDPSIFLYKCSGLWFLFNNGIIIMSLSNHIISCSVKTKYVYFNPNYQKRAMVKLLFSKL